MHLCLLSVMARAPFWGLYCSCCTLTIFLNGFPDNPLCGCLLMIAFSTGRSAQVQTQANFNVILINLLPGNELGWCPSTRLNVSCFALPRGDRLYSSTRLQGHVLEQVSTAKYLGLNLHERLSWNYHTDVTTKKANRIRSFITRNVHLCPKKVKAACLYIQWWNMLLLCGHLTPHRTVTN